MVRKATFITETSAKYMRTRLRISSATATGSNSSSSEGTCSSLNDGSDGIVGPVIVHNPDAVVESMVQGAGNVGSPRMSLNRSTQTCIPARISTPWQSQQAVLWRPFAFAFGWAREGGGGLQLLEEQGAIGERRTS